MTPIRCSRCQQDVQADGDAADILEARLAAGGVIPCPQEGCTGTCQPVTQDFEAPVAA